MTLKNIMIMSVRFAPRFFPTWEFSRQNLRTGNELKILELDTNINGNIDGTDDNRVFGDGMFFSIPELNSSFYRLNVFDDQNL